MEKIDSIDTYDEILTHIRLALKDVIRGGADLDNGSLKTGTRLGADLGLKSLDFVRFAGSLQRRLKAGPLRFQQLFVNADGSFSEDISIGRLREFCKEALLKR